MDLKTVAVPVPDDCNVIIGQSHFIKTVEDIYEAVVGSVPAAKFGLAFNEASGPCLVRYDGNDEELERAAVAAAREIGAGHAFVLFLKNAFPLNVLNQVKACPEVCRIFCATANALEVVVAETEQGRGIVGVIDGASPKGVEEEADREWRRVFLRKIGYKR
ncbi:MAG: adenosine monophosphate-protein transferase [Acidobacteria bacterium]|nr:MAG: adenosine monophosphate-protein transferase [Acidobacteriota bacterium]